MCWNWQANVTGQGYGMFWIHDGTKARGVSAHRFSFSLSTGESIPEGLNICHTCDNPLCVNPDHLFVGTQSDNMKDCHQKGRTRKTWEAGERHPLRSGAMEPRRGQDAPTATLTDQQARDIIRDRLTGTDTETLMKRHSATRQIITNICAGRKWKHVYAELSDAQKSELKAISNAHRGAKKITRQGAKEIKAALAAGQSCASIALERGVTVGCIHHIKSGLTWVDA